MDVKRKELKSYTLTSEEIEKLLTAEFGKRLEPVDNMKLAKQNQRRAKHRPVK